MPWLNNKPNVSCIPVGTYEIRYSFSHHFRKYSIEILNVPGRTGIRIHSANVIEQLKGCVAVGEAFKLIDKDMFIINSRNTVIALEDLILKQLVSKIQIL